MKRFGQLASGVALVLLRQETAGAQTRAFEVELSAAKWMNISPRDTASRYAVLHIDPTTGATQMVYRLAPTVTSPCHWHTASQGTVVVRGAETVSHGSQPDGVTLGVGGFSFVPARLPFRIRAGPTEAIIFATLDGPFDIHIVPEAQCRPQ